MHWPGLTPPKALSNTGRALNQHHLSDVAFYLDNPKKANAIHSIIKLEARA